MATPQEKQKKLLLLKAEVGVLHAQELELILAIRRDYRFGQITIETREGLPFDILQTVKRTRLSTA